MIIYCIKLLWQHLFYYHLLTQSFTVKELLSVSMLRTLTMYAQRSDIYP